MRIVATSIYKAAFLNTGSSVYQREIVAVLEPVETWRLARCRVARISRDSYDARLYREKHRWTPLSVAETIDQRFSLKKETVLADAGQKGISPRELNRLGAKMPSVLSHQLGDYDLPPESRPAGPSLAPIFVPNVVSLAV